MIGAASFTGSDGGIYSKLRFRVLDDWRPHVRDPAPDVDVLIIGGEIVRDGERLRMEDAEGQYRLGQRYVLIAGGYRQAGDAVLRAYLHFLPVDGGVIHVAPGEMTFANGVSTIQASADVARAVAMAPCR